ncbi:DUF427 domain-containing protein [Labedaea rhizosphaerae]|uniref:Uncharacterized protein (DUF427 family) n=1 Tax=Labedaea rhizosphaerae TaxID=598644 RepID=A0A4R6SH67_LABRH|nr:DUF427 domain-containing protein [Labedaea rhizosphaerae]TDQ00268.1 uncharacterized protein (DUF427 family) [Labedaea rhizosphaerae]
MTGYPGTLVAVGHVEPVPRRIRAVLASRTVLDTTRALYVWEEGPPYPQFYIPVEDVAPGVLVDEDHRTELRFGSARRHGLRVGDVDRPGAARLFTESATAELAGTVRIDWAAMDAWFEEDEEVFVHPRDPYARVDAIRSTRTVRVSCDGIALAESSSTVMVFETGLPTRYYFNQTEVDFSHLEPSATETACPYKGRTGKYWSVRVGDTLHQDLAWLYHFTTLALTPIAGLVAFYNEKVDIELDGVAQQRPVTHFS